MNWIETTCLAWYHNFLRLAGKEIASQTRTSVWRTTRMLCKLLITIDCLGKLERSIFFWNLRKTKRKNELEWKRTWRLWPTDKLQCTAATWILESALSRSDKVCCPLLRVRMRPLDVSAPLLILRSLLYSSRNRPFIHRSAQRGSETPARDTARRRDQGQR